MIKEDLTFPSRYGRWPVSSRTSFRHFFPVLIFLMFACGLSISVQAQDLIWAKQTGENNEAHGYGISVLPDGSSLVTGDFRTTVSFGPGEIGETILTSTGDGLDLFVARYNPDGTLAWVKQAGGSADDGGSGISVMADGSSLVTGYFRETATFGLGEPGETTLNSAGSWDIFVARYNPDGTLAWAKRAGVGAFMMKVVRIFP